MISREQMLALRVAWVGGWGFLCFEYPEKACRIFLREPTSMRLREIRIMGAVELIIVFISCILTFVTPLPKPRVCITCVNPVEGEVFAF
jgi:hypothetical protein